MLILDNILYSYRKGLTPALQGVSARIDKGIHLLLGENGAGKTTLLHLMAGLIRPALGTVTVDGEILDDNALKARSAIFMLEENMCFPYKSIREFAKAHSPFYPRYSPEIFEQALEAFSLTGHEKMSSLSLGNRKKSQLAYVLALRTEYLLLDEPTNGLDISSKETLLRLIATHVPTDITMVISTHSIGELEYLYDGIIAVSHGQLLLCADAQQIENSLAFVTSREHTPQALYEKQELGLYRQIIPVGEQTPATSVDWKLLYQALCGPNSERIKSIVGV